MLKWLNIGLSADSSGLRKDMEVAATVVEQQSEKIAQAAVSGGDKFTKAQEKSSKALDTLQRQFRQADKDAQILAQTQGMTSQAFVNAAKRAGELRDELMDVREVSAAFASGTPVLQSSLGMVQGMAGAYATAQSAAALFGVENENLQQTLLKVQAAMALMQGLQQLEAISSAYVAFSAVLKTQVLPAIMTVNGALMASGIGLIIVGVIALTTAVNSYNAAIDREIDLEKQSIENKKLLNDALSKSRSEIMRTDELRVRAMKDGLEKELAMIELRKKAEKEKEKALFESSNKNVFDVQRANENVRNIDAYYASERLKIIKKFNEEAEKEKQKAATATTITAPQIKTIGSRDPLDAFIPSKKMMEDAKIRLDQFQNEVYQKNVAWGQSLEQLSIRASQVIEANTEQAISGMAQALGEGLANGANVAEAMGAVLLGAIGTMAVQLGELAIGTGIAIGGIKKALTSLNPAVAVVAGVALVALGSAVKAKASSIAKGGGGGGDTGGSFGGNLQSFQPFGSNQPTSTLIQVGGNLRGSDIQLSVVSTNKAKNRVR
jgi:hypothetical protein